MELLIYTDPDTRDVGYLGGFSLDLENGREDDFEIKLPLESFNLLSAGCLIYCENQPQYGGRVEKLNPNTSAQTVNFIGSTWRGIFKKKILLKNIEVTPNKTLAEITAAVIEAAELTELFAPEANGSAIGATMSVGQYLTPLAALETILNAVGCRPSFRYDPKSRRVLVGSDAVRDFSKSEYDSTQISMELTVNKMPTNHIIGIDKSGRAHHLYLMHDGSYSQTQEIKGAAEVTKLIEISSDYSADILLKLTEAMDAEQKAAASSALSVGDISAEIGDIVGAFEQQSKTFVVAKVTSKVLKMTDKTFLINFETGEF